MPPRSDLHLVALLHLAAREISAILEDHLRKEGLPKLTARQAIAMLTINRRPSVPQTQLAELVAMDRSSLSEMLRRMLRKGLISRARGDDARSLLVTLSAKGQALVPQIQRAESATTKAVAHAVGSDGADLRTKLAQLHRVRSSDATTTRRPI